MVNAGHGDWRTMELTFLDALHPETKQQVTTLLLGLAIGAALLFGARLVAAVLKGTLRWSAVARGCRPIPAAPGGGLLLGHALQLARALGDNAEGKALLAANRRALLAQHSSEPSA